MIKLDHFNKTVERLLQAYQNNTLELYNAYTDVIGTLVAAGLGYEIEQGLPPGKTTGKKTLVWTNNGTVLPYPNLNGERINGWLAAFFYHADHSLVIRKDCLHGEALKQIMATGYKPKEILQLLQAFRSHNAGDTNDRIYCGLLNVLETLAEIHGIADNNLVERNSELFKAYYQKLRSASDQPTQPALSTTE